MTFRDSGDFMNMNHPPRLILVLGWLGALGLAGCVGEVTMSASPGRADPSDPSSPSDPSNPSNPTTTPPGVQKLPSCTTDADCTAPYLCNTQLEKCVPPAAKNSGPCDPIDGKSCPTGQQCISGVCIPPPGSCQTNDDCPVGYLCQNGTCVPDGGSGGGGGCKSNADCSSSQFCMNGLCMAQEICTVAHALDRMNGTWVLDSQLHVRDGLQGLTGGLLSIAGTLQTIIDGTFSIPGVPSFLSGIVGSTVKSMIQGYVPPWGISVIGLLAQINDVIDDTHVVSVETIQALGNDMYAGQSTWTLVEFEYQGAKVSTAPENIPGLGTVTTESYSAREVCGAFYIDKHKVNNAIGKIFRWAIEAVITGVSCNSDVGACYQDMNSMFNDLVDCTSLASAVASAGLGAGIDSLVLAACISQKQGLIDLIIKELDSLALNLTYMNLGARADIASESQLLNGRWYGTLGGAYGKGNFEGTFTGMRQ